MMKIAYLTNQYPKVSHTFIRREIEAVEARGVEVQRYSIRPCPDELVDEADRRELERTRVLLPGGASRYAGPLLLGVLLTVLTRPWRFVRALRMAVRLGNQADQGLMLHLAYLAEACVFCRAIQREGCRHVHAHFGNNPTVVALLARRLGGPPYSFTVHGTATLDRLASAGLPEKVGGAAFTVAISEYTRAQVMRFTDPADHGRIHVVRCGLDQAFRDCAAEPAGDSRRLVCVARLSVEKGLLVLLEAMAQLVKSGEALELVLVGDGPERLRIEQAIERHGLGECVRITGWASSDEVRQWLSQARAFVLPSFAEGLPVVVMEAMALRRPVVSTAVSGIPELVVPGETGWLVPVGSVDALASALRKALHASPEALERMGACAVRRVWEHHDVQREADKLLVLMRRVMDAQRDGGVEADVGGGAAPEAHTIAPADGVGKAGAGRA